MASPETLFVVPDPSLVPTPVAITDLEQIRPEDQYGMTLDKRLSETLRRTMGPDGVPFSGLILMNRPSEDFDREVATIESNLGLITRSGLDLRERSTDEVTLFDGPVDLDLVRLRSLGESVPDSGSAAVWILSPSPTDPFSDPAMFPSDTDLPRLTASRFVALLPSSEEWDGPDLDYAEAICIYLAPWSRLQGKVADDVAKPLPPADPGEVAAVSHLSSDETAAGDQNPLADAIEALRLAENDSRESDQDLRIVYRQGRELGRKESYIRHQAALKTDEVRLESLTPVVDSGSPTQWIEACRKPVDDCLERMRLARDELSQLSTQATQVFTYLNLAQSSRTQTIVEVVGIVVFMLGILGVYFSSVTGTPKVPDFQGDGAQFTVFSLVIIAIYSAALYWLAKRWRPEWRPSSGQKQGLIGIGFILIVVGVVASAIMNNGIPGLIALPVATLIAAPALARR